MRKKGFYALLYLEALGIEEVILKQGEISKESALAKLLRYVEKCQRCPLYKTKKNKVFGSGNPYASLMLVGEAPGAEEDATGKPFVGRAGKLLTELLEENGINREEETFIANVLKCRPPGNRDPKPEEIKACSPFLRAQIKIIKPELLVALGRFSAYYLYGKKLRMEDMRGRLLKSVFGIPLIVTYHPAAALRYPQILEKSKEDFKFLKEIYTRIRAQGA